MVITSAVPLFGHAGHVHLRRVGDLVRAAHEH